MSHRTADERIAEELSRHGLRATRQRIAALRRLRREIPARRIHQPARESHLIDWDASTRPLYP